MMMTFGTFEADAQEQLADKRRDFLRLTAIAEQHRSPIVPRRTTGCDQLANELIVLLILAKALANPGVIGHHCLDADTIWIRPQQVGPLRRPVVGILRPLEQFFNDAVAFGVVTICQKRADLLRRRLPADDVEINAP
jgi:hypothetical protein